MRMTNVRENVLLHAQLPWLRNPSYMNKSDNNILACNAYTQSDYVQWTFDRRRHDNDHNEHQHCWLLYEHHLHDLLFHRYWIHLFHRPHSAKTVCEWMSNVRHQVLTFELKLTFKYMEFMLQQFSLPKGTLYG